MATTPKTPPQVAIKPQDVPVSNPDNIRATYSNFFGVGATMTDFTIYFLEVGQKPTPAGNVQTNEVKAMVTLPMAAAAGLQEVLQQVMTQADEAQKQAQEAAASGKQ